MDPISRQESSIALPVTSANPFSLAEPLSDDTWWHQDQERQIRTQGLKKAEHQRGLTMGFSPWYTPCYVMFFWENWKNNINFRGTLFWDKPNLETKKSVCCSWSPSHWRTLLQVMHHFFLALWRGELNSVFEMLDAVAILLQTITWHEASANQVDWVDLEHGHSDYY